MVKGMDYRRVLSCLLLVAALVLLPSQLARAAGGEAAAVADFSERVKAAGAYAAAQLERAGVVGGVYGIVHKDRLVLANGMGTTDLRAHKTPDARTVYNAASVTKAVTAAAVLQLEAQGLLHLDDPVRHYLPWFRFKDEALSAKVTLRHLLLHAAGGVDSWATDGLLFDTPDTRHRLEDYVRSLRKADMSSKPGTKAAYCNGCYNVLGLVIEQAKGMDYADYLAENLFRPLGMTRSFYGKPPQDLPEMDLAREYFWLFTRKTELARSYAAYGASANPEGGMYTTLEDLAKFASWQLGYAKAASLQPSPIESEEALIASVASGGGSSYTVGGYESELLYGSRVVHKGGDGIGTATFLMLLPEQELGVLLLIGEHRPEIQKPIAMGMAGILLGEEAEPIAVRGTFGYLMGWAAIALAGGGAMLLLFLIRSLSRFGLRDRHPRRSLFFVMLSGLPAACIWYAFAFIRPSGVFFYGYPYDIAIGGALLGFGLTLWSFYLSMKVIVSLSRRRKRVEGGLAIMMENET
ncbi:serine hydrolase domain-containing protein [Paenibacillus methanolicus]|uniref:CubicO group peptidase (Beta-lactamase class C family) n=1 Tax=Paenibacillus methanolicus TaxID=582686 RepID=A0A5S5BX31_9BACL|nr:serine hydrolase domain-containing protein [Paenibacillus methanolicus]TYP70742.1 CubicO group peptidase (beta-lactamase class C family) [Paenibacillus methanolicus]